jgi:hypothetical protein
MYHGHSMGCISGRFASSRGVRNQVWLDGTYKSGCTTRWSQSNGAVVLQSSVSAAACLNLAVLCVFLYALSTCPSLSAYRA